jgi:hypothetical protein
MTLDDLRARLAAIPDAEAPPAGDLDASVAYLASDRAAASLAEDAYWPKWDSPWWHMLLLHELGEARRIPARAVRAMIAALDRYPLHSFPLRDDDWPPGAHKARDAACHCALGNIDQVLAACGVDVDAELPWFGPWYDRYQMADGGYNCDESAYLVGDECPSSMVGTIAMVEAQLRRRGAALERGAGFLIGRALVHGSETRHNAEERDAAPAWLAPTFPRFYFYDVLRGLTALVRWATLTGGTIPPAAIAPAAEHLATIAADGVVRIGRQAHAGRGTWRRGDDGGWARAPLASSFALLDAVSVPGAPSRALTTEWRVTRTALLGLIDAGQVR